MYDVFFLSFDEAYADRHWAEVKKKLPYARRVKNVHGIHEAHKKAASMAWSEHFFVIDSDNEILDWGIFDTKVEDWSKEYVHLWYAKNPINDLVYGWGGVKLFPKKLFTDSRMGLDMTTSFPLRVMDTIASITHFNYSPEETWRSAFREAVKLSQKADEEAAERLSVWMTHAHGPYAAYALLGAAQGAEYGNAHVGDTGALMCINDYAWLSDRFKSVEPIPQ